MNEDEPRLADKGDGPLDERETQTANEYSLQGFWAPLFRCNIPFRLQGWIGCPGSSHLNVRYMTKVPGHPVFCNWTLLLKHTLISSLVSILHTSWILGSRHRFLSSRRLVVLLAPMRNVFRRQPMDAVILLCYLLQNSAAIRSLSLFIRNRSAQPSNTAVSLPRRLYVTTTSRSQLIHARLGILETTVASDYHATF